MKEVKYIIRLVNKALNEAEKLLIEMNKDILLLKRKVDMEKGKTTSTLSD